MAENGIFFSDYLAVCPYNSSHTILRTRLQPHLVKCKKGYSDKEICPFNSTHHIDATEFGHHVSTCPDRRTLDGFKYTVGPERMPENILPVENRDIPCDENWDDTDVPTYNPATRLEDGKLLVQIKGATPSERKKFREDRRLKFLQENANQQSKSEIETFDDIEIIDDLTDEEHPAVLPCNAMLTENKKPISECMTDDFDCENAAWGWQNPEFQKAFECDKFRKGEEFLNNHKRNEKCFKQKIEQKTANFASFDFQPLYGYKYQKLSRVDRNSPRGISTYNESNFPQACTSRGTGRNESNCLNQTQNNHPESSSMNCIKSAENYRQGDNFPSVQNFNGRRENGAKVVSGQGNQYPRQNETRMSSPSVQSFSSRGLGIERRSNFGSRAETPTINNVAGYQLGSKGRGVIIQSFDEVGYPPDFRPKPMSSFNRWGECGSFERLASTWRDKVAGAPNFEINNATWPDIQEAPNTAASNIKQHYSLIGHGGPNESNIHECENQNNWNLTSTSTEDTSYFQTMPYNHEDRIVLKTPSDFEVPTQQNHFRPIAPAGSNNRMLLLSPSDFSVQSASTIVVTSGRESVSANGFN